MMITDAPSFQAATGFTDVQMADLAAFRNLLEDWNAKMNLVGPSAMAEFWSRHAYDSAQLLKIAPDARVWADLGAGAGFPGIVLAIGLKGQDGAKVHLIESMAKRCRFLSEAVGTLGLPAQVHNCRAESMKLAVDIVTARACAPLVRLLGYARPYLSGKTRALFLKGREVENEIAEAQAVWIFKHQLIPSRSGSDGRILIIEGGVRAR